MSIRTHHHYLFAQTTIKTCKSIQLSRARCNKNIDNCLEKEFIMTIIQFIVTQNYRQGTFTMLVLKVDNFEKIYGRWQCIPDPVNNRKLENCTIAITQQH